MKYTRLLALLLFYHCRVLAQSSTDTSVSGKIDSYLLSAHAAGQFNGTALIMEKGKTLLEKGYGYREADQKLSNDSTTIFQIGSMTKSFTAVTVLKLQEEGKLSVTDKISKYLPAFPKGDSITIENLLTHTSGIYNFTNDIDDNDTSIICYPVSKDIVLNVFKDKPLEFRPRTAFSYSNSNYFLLGMILEKVTGQPYETVIRRTILSPLQMTNSGFDFKNLASTNKAQGYLWLTKDSVKKNYTVDSTVYYAAGAMYSNVTDLAKWARAMATQQIIQPASWHQAFTPGKTNYGYGFFLDSLSGHSSVGHTGGLLGFISDIAYFPKEDVTIILLSNVGNYGGSLLPLVNGISAIVFHQPYTNWQTAPANGQSNKLDLQRYTGIYDYNKDHRIIVTFEKGNLFLEDTNPKDRLPRVQLYALGDHTFYMKEAQLKFEFRVEENQKVSALFTYITPDKKEEWKKVK